MRGAPGDGCPYRDYIGRRAAEWIATIPDDFPWHYFVSFVGPHDPFDAPKEYADRYRTASMPAPIPSLTSGKSTAYSSRQSKMDPDEIEETRRMYCAAVELIDDQIGLILEALDNRNMLENTVIVFTSDHGEMLGDHGLYSKSFGYEQSIRVPLLIAGPNIPRGRTSEGLVELIDINPTICEASGLPRQEGIDAISLLPLLRGETETHRDDAYSALAGFRSMRTDAHKLIENYNDWSELYDLVNDPWETTNLSGESSAIESELRDRMHKRLTEAKWQR